MAAHDPARARRSLFVVVALALRGPIQDDLFGGSATLYWILLVGGAGLRGELLRARLPRGPPPLRAVRRARAHGGQLALPVRARRGGRDRRGADGGGARHGGGADRVAGRGAAGRSARRLRAPRAGGARRPPTPSREAAGEPEFTLAHGTGFAAAVLLIMLARADLPERRAAAGRGHRGRARARRSPGFAFNVLLIARAPLQLFQAVQTSILPHLTRLRAGGETDPFRRSVNLTLLAIAGFAACVALVMLVAGPALMDLVFGGDFDYERGGLVLVSVGMGLYLSAATLNQALLAHGRAPQAAAPCWARPRPRSCCSCCSPDFDDRGAPGRAGLPRRGGLPGARCTCSTGALLPHRSGPASPAPRALSAGSAMAKNADVGDPAPDFELEGTDGPLPALRAPRRARRSCSSTRATTRTVCTKQFCSYRDNAEAFGALDATVVGHLGQAASTPTRGFTDKHQLTVPLLADADSTVAKAYGAHAPVVRTTQRAVIIVDEDGRGALPARPPARARLPDRRRPAARPSPSCPRAAVR